MKRKLSTKRIIEHIQPLCVDLTETTLAVYEKVREQKLTYSDAIKEFTTYRVSEEEKLYMLDDTDYEIYESPKKLIFGKKPESNKPKPLQKSSNDIVDQVAKV